MVATVIAVEMEAMEVSITGADTEVTEVAGPESEVAALLLLFEENFLTPALRLFFKFVGSTNPGIPEKYTCFTVNAV